jgi:hypothetical protein
MDVSQVLLPTVGSGSGFWSTYANDITSSKLLAISELLPPTPTVESIKTVE